MWPYADDENAWLSGPSNHTDRSEEDWPTPEMVQLYVRRAEALRAAVIAAAFNRAGRWLAATGRRAWHSVADHWRTGPKAYPPR